MTAFIQLRAGRVMGCYEHGNEPMGYHEMLGISRVAKQLLASQEGLAPWDQLVNSMIRTI
jgi:hypothetical protein